MGIDEAGDHGAAAHVDRARIREPSAHLVLRTHGQDAGAVERHGLRPRPPAIGREHPASVQHDLRIDIPGYDHATS